MSDTERLPLQTDAGKPVDEDERFTVLMTGHERDCLERVRNAARQYLEWAEDPDEVYTPDRASDYESEVMEAAVELELGPDAWDRLNAAAAEGEEDHGSWEQASCPRCNDPGLLDVDGVRCGNPECKHYMGYCYQQPPGCGCEAHEEDE